MRGIAGYPESQGMEMAQEDRKMLASIKDFREKCLLFGLTTERDSLMTPLSVLSEERRDSLRLFSQGKPDLPGWETGFRMSYKRGGEALQSINERFFKPFQLRKRGVIMPDFIKSARSLGYVMIFVLVTASQMIGGCQGNDSKKVFKKQIDKAMKK